VRRCALTALASDDPKPGAPLHDTQLHEHALAIPCRDQRRGGAYPAGGVKGALRTPGLTASAAPRAGAEAAVREA
jgi:hypothetical protein